MYQASLTALTLLAASTASAAPPSRGFQEQFPAEAIARFDLEIPAGDIHIRAERVVGLVTVDATPVTWPEGCTVDIGQDADRAWTRMTQNTLLRSCRLDVAVTVGMDTVLLVRVGQGNVRITNLGGALTADLGAGDVLLEDVSGPVDVEMGSGQLEGSFSGPRLHAQVGSGGVHLAGLRAPVSVEIGLGNIDLTYSEAPAGRIDARVGTGSIKILLPPDTDVRTELSLGLGSKRVHLPETSEAITEIHATTAVGRILVGPTAESLEDEE